MNRQFIPDREIVLSKDTDLLNTSIYANNLVLKAPKPRYEKPCKPVGNGWLVNTCSDTPTKYEQIHTISERLNLGILVEII